MGAGGIIQQRAAVLFAAVKDPSIWGGLDPHAVKCVDDIEAKGLVNADQNDVNWLACILYDAVVFE